MNKFRKMILALALTASLGFSTQAFAEVGTTATGTTGTTGTYGTGTTTGTVDTTGTGTTATGTTATGTTATGTTNNMLDRMNTYGTTNYGYGGRYGTTNYRANADTTTRGTNWGWIGLFGLLGMAGMRGRDRKESHK